MMMRAKKIAIAAVAALAMMVVAGGAQASAAEFHVSSGAGTSIIGASKSGIVMNLQGSTFACTTARLTGTASAPASPAQALHPEFTGCSAFGGGTASVNTAGCDLNFHASDGSVDVESCFNGGIVFTWTSILGKCTFSIFNQTGGTGATFTNDAQKSSYGIGGPINLTADVLTSTGICPVGGKGRPVQLEADFSPVRAAMGLTWVE